MQDGLAIDSQIPTHFYHASAQLVQAVINVSGGVNSVGHVKLHDTIYP